MRLLQWSKTSAPPLKQSTRTAVAVATVAMWIVIRFDRARDSQTNEAVFETQESLVKYIDALVTNCKNARIVMLPTDADRVHKKMLPAVTSADADFYVQWLSNCLPN